MKTVKEYSVELISAMEKSLINQNKDEICECISTAIQTIANKEFYEIKDKEDPAMDFN